MITLEAVILNCDLKLISKDSNSPTEWYGGSSAELTTYPQNSSFANRDFLWRLGYAKINIPQSTFSKLCGVSRHLMVMSGKVELNHAGHYKKTLCELESDSFSGDYDTNTSGTCSVFNLMTRENYKGLLTSMLIKPKTSQFFSKTLSYNQEIVAVCLYPISGRISTTINDEIYEVSTNDLLRIDYIDANSSISLQLSCISSETCKVIISLIYK